MLYLAVTRESCSFAAASGGFVYCSAYTSRKPGESELINGKNFLPVFHSFIVTQVYYEQPPGTYQLPPQEVA